VYKGERGKNAVRERAIQIKTRGVKNAYKLARTKERRLFRKKARQLDEEALIEIERHRRIQDSRKFYKRLNDVRRPFEPQVVMCRAKNGELLTNKNQVLARWEEHFEEHLNEGSESEQPTRPVDLRDDGVDIDLPSRDEIEGALKYLKNNKAAGVDSIAAAQLKNGGPNLVDALHAVIQQAWTGETLPRSWPKGVLYPVYKKGDKLDCKSYRGICLLNVTYKVFAKILYDRLLPHANAAVQHYQAGFQSGKSTTDQLFALRQILEICNEFNITTHHIFIDFKAPYDTIIKNEVYVGMSEVNFSTKLIRLTKATLTIVTCCVKIQNDCSESFETRQGLRQGSLMTPTNEVSLEIKRRIQTANMCFFGNCANISGRATFHARKNPPFTRP
jgi:hypothetical protein